MAVVASTISLYYYLQLIRRMYLLDPAAGEEARWRLSPASYVATGTLTLAMFAIGFYAGPLFTIADRAARVLSLT